MNRPPLRIECNGKISAKKERVMIRVPDFRQFYQMSAAAGSRQNAILWAPRCQNAEMQEIRRANALLLSRLFPNECTGKQEELVKKSK